MSDTRQVDIFPWLLARIAGGEAKCLDDIKCKKTAALIQEVREKEVEMEKIREEVNQALYHLVSKLEDTKLRDVLRGTLKLKRDVFNGRTPRLESTLLERVLERLDVQEALLLSKWLQMAKKRDELIRQTDQLAVQEWKEVSTRLAERMGHPEWQKGLVLANPDYIRTYRSDRLKQWLPKKQYARASVSYLGRIVAKTSPFSTLTQLALASFQSEWSVSEKGGSYCRISQALAVELLFALAKDDEFRPQFHYEWNPSIRIEGEQIRYLTSSFTMYNGFAWREDRRQEETLLEADRAIFVSQFSERKEPDVANLPADVVIHWLKKQWIRPILPFPRNDSRPMGSLAKYLREYPSRRARRIARLADWIDQCVVAMGRGDAVQRFRWIQHIKKLATRAFDEMERPQPACLKKGHFVYEDVRYSDSLPPLGECLKMDLERVAKKIRPYLFRSHAYDLLVDHFIATYGEGGKCDDILGFLDSFEQRRDRARLMKKAMRLDRKVLREGPSSRSFLPVSKTSAPPSLLLFFQLDAQKGEDALQNGYYSLVLNHANPGLGGMFNRQLPVLNPGSGLAGSMKTWLKTMYPDVRICDFPTIADYSTLQINWGITDQALRWPGETATTEKQADLSFSDLSLVHNNDGTLTVLGPDGFPIAPQYLGTVPQYLVRGILSHFLTLLNPWLNAFPVFQRFQNGPPPEEIEYHPRIQDGRIVESRAHWRVPRYLFPEKKTGESDISYFRRLKTWQLDHGIPEEVFIAGESSDMLNPRKRKPLWLSFDSYHSVMSAIHTLFDEELLSFTLTEAFPSRDGCWLTDSKGKPRASELITWMRWPRPSLEG